MADIQSADAFVDHQIHDLQNLPHEQHKRQDKEDDEEGESDFPEYVTADNFIHIGIKLPEN
jgi:hypothetical protein